MPAQAFHNEIEEIISDVIGNVHSEAVRDPRTGVVVANVDTSVENEIRTTGRNLFEPMRIAPENTRGLRSQMIFTDNIANNYKYIKPHNYVPPRFNFNRINNEDGLYLGVELEVDNGGKSDFHAKNTIDILGEDNVYCMHDGSLNNGFEITTHPCTLEYHKQLKYQDAFKYLIKNGYRSHNTNTCGIHVHFNRNYFGDKAYNQEQGLSKLLYLIENHWNEVSKIARRDNLRYANRYYIKKEDKPRDIIIKFKHGGKHMIVNSIHKNTFEIRIFKGTLKYDTFIATLEFCKHIINIAKNYTLKEISNMSWDYICSGMPQNLLDYIESRKNKKIKKTESSHLSGISYMDTNSFGFFRSAVESLQEITFTAPTITLEEMSDAELKKKIKKLKKQESRSRNYLEQQQLRRDMQKLRKELRRR